METETIKINSADELRAYLPDIMFSEQRPAAENLAEVMDYAEKLQTGTAFDVRVQNDGVCRKIWQRHNGCDVLIATLKSPQENSKGDTEPTPKTTKVSKPVKNEK